MSTSELPELPPPHTRVGVGGVLIRDGRVLLNRAVYRSRFTIPSGYVDPGESLDAALVREFEEETGVQISVGRLLLVRHKAIDRAASDAYFAYAVAHRSGEPTARPPEIAEIREVPLEEAVTALWIPELSRIAIRLAAAAGTGWNRLRWRGGEVPGLSSEAYGPEL